MFWLFSSSSQCILSRFCIRMHSTSKSVGASASAEGSKERKDASMVKDKHKCQGIFARNTISTYSLDPSASYRPADPLDQFEVFSLAFSNDSRLLAAAGSNSLINIYNTSDGSNVSTLFTEAQSLPITCVRFRPYTFHGGASNVLAAACADGTVTHWHVPSQTCLFKIEEPDNQVSEHIHALLCNDACILFCDVMTRKSLLSVQQERCSVVCLQAVS